MNIVLYNTSSENNKVNKTLTNSTTLSGNIKAPTSVVNPTITIQGNPIGKNYAYISEFHRYYFIRDIRIINNTVFELDLEVDPLMSFASQIRGLTAIIKRQEHVGVTDYVDVHLDEKTTQSVAEYEFSGAKFDDQTNIIISNGLLGEWE